GPVEGTITASPALAATYDDPDGDAGSVELRICTSPAALGASCGGLVATSTANGLASGATAGWSASGLARGSTYYWQTRARDGAGAPSAWTATRSFVVDAAPSDPALTAPADGTITKAAVLSA